MSTQSRQTAQLKEDASKRRKQEAEKNSLDSGNGGSGGHHLFDVPQKIKAGYVDEFGRAIKHTLGDYHSATKHICQKGPGGTTSKHQSSKVPNGVNLTVIRPATDSKNETPVGPENRKLALESPGSDFKSNVDKARISGSNNSGPSLLNSNSSAVSPASYAQPLSKSTGHFMAATKPDFSANAPQENHSHYASGCSPSSLSTSATSVVPIHAASLRTSPGMLGTSPSPKISPLTAKSGVSSRSVPTVKSLTTPPNGTVHPYKKVVLPPLMIPEEKRDNFAGQSVDDILKEMTQIQPPLTGIETPRKANIKFPFPVSDTAASDASDTGYHKSSVEVQGNRQQEDQNSDLLTELNVSDDSDVGEVDSAVSQQNPPMNAGSTREVAGMSSSSESSSEQSDSSSGSSASDSSEEEEEEPKEREEEEEPKSKEEEHRSEESKQCWGLRRFKQNQPQLLFHVDPLVTGTKQSSKAAETASQSREERAHQDAIPVSGSSKSRHKEIPRLGSLPFEIAGSEDLEEDLQRHGNGVHAASPSDKVPTSASGLKSSSTNNDSSAGIKGASGKQQSSRRQSVSGSSVSSGKSSSKHNCANKNSDLAPVKTHSKTPSSSSSQVHCSKSSSSSRRSSVSEDKNVKSSENLWSTSKNKRLISSDESDSDDKVDQLSSGQKESDKEDHGSSLSERELIARTLFSDSSPLHNVSPVHSHRKTGSKVRTVQTPEIKVVETESSNSSKNSCHKKQPRDSSSGSDKTKRVKKLRNDENKIPCVTDKEVEDVLEPSHFKSPDSHTTVHEISNSVSSCPFSLPPCSCPRSTNLQDSVFDMPLRLCRRGVNLIDSSPSTALTQSVTQKHSVVETERLSSSLQNSKESLGVVEGKAAQDTVGRVLSPSHSNSLDRPKQFKPTCELNKQEGSARLHKSRLKTSKSNHAENGVHGSERKRHRSSSTDKHSNSTSHAGHKKLCNSSIRLPHSPQSDPVTQPDRNNLSQSSPVSASQKPIQNEVPQQNGRDHLPFMTYSKNTDYTDHSPNPLEGESCFRFSADHYLQTAKTLKHQADKLTAVHPQLLMYLEAVLTFIQCGHAMEREQISDSAKISTMYSDTLHLLKTIKNRCQSESEKSPEPSPLNKKLTVLMLRIQSFLSLKLYHLKKVEGAKFRRILEQDNNMKISTVKSHGQHHAPSPHQSSWNNRNSSIPSPRSPTPSPAGSTGSIGSRGSCDVPSKINGNVPNANTLHSLNTVTISTRIYNVQQQYFRIVNYLVNSHDLWEQADVAANDCKDFFDAIDNSCRPLAVNSSVVHLVQYVRVGIQRLRDLTNT